MGIVITLTTVSHTSDSPKTISNKIAHLSSSVQSCLTSEWANGEDPRTQGAGKGISVETRGQRTKTLCKLAKWSDPLALLLKRYFPTKCGTLQNGMYIHMWTWSKHTWMSTYLSTKWLLDISSYSYNMVGFHLQKYRSITLRGLRGDLL